MARHYIFYLAFAGILMACQKQPESTQELSVSASTGDPSSLEIETARKQVAQWHKEMLDTEATLLDLYKGNKNEELEVLAEKLSAQNGAPGDNGTWKSDAYRTYLKCDTAWGKLGLFAGVLKMNAKTPTPSMNSIIDSQKREYEDSKTLCEQRLSLPPLEAYKQYLNS